MTVSYALAVSTATVSSFLKLLARWSGSLWKLVVVELLMWIIITVSLYILTEYMIKGSSTEKPLSDLANCLYGLDSQSAATFLLGMMTSSCMTRWQHMYKLLVFPDQVAHLYNAYVNENIKGLSSNDHRLIRKTVARYITFSYILLQRDISMPVRKRFPSLDLLTQKGGIITESELKLLNSSRLSESACHFWIPLQWIINLVKAHYLSKESSRRADPSDQGIFSESHFSAFVNEILRIRGELGDILSYDCVPLPLAYVQIVTFVVYGTIVVSCLGVQKIAFEYDSSRPEVYLQMIYTLTVNVILIGWLKCAQVMVNPFGEDDDDYELNFLLDRHWEVLSELLSGGHSRPPSLHINPVTLPHTVASALIIGRGGGLIGSLAHGGRDEESTQFQQANAAAAPYADSAA